MSEMTKQGRLLDEVIRVGGESTLNDFSSEERKMWDQQSLVLSHIREVGDITKAAFCAGQNPTMVSDWHENNTLDFQHRQAQALEEVGQSLVGTLVERLQAGELTAIGHWDRAFRVLLPKVFAKAEGSDKAAGREVIEHLRANAAQHQRLIDEQRQLLEAQATAEEAEPGTLAPIIDLAARRRE